MEDRVVFVVVGGVTLSVLLLAAGVALTHTPNVSRGVLAIYWLLAMVFCRGQRDSWLAPISSAPNVVMMIVSG